MSKKDNLLQFIHLMTASEKKYFKQFISVRKDSKFYAALFDMLQKQEEYDATTLSKKLKKTTKQISDGKDYLMQVLLKSMENFHADTTPMIRVNNLLNQAEVASIRGISSLAFDLLDKAETICVKFDFFLPLIAIYKRRQSLHAVQYELSESVNASRRIEEYLIKEKNLAEYRDLHKKITHFTMTGRAKTIDLSEEYFQSHPLLQEPSTALSVTAKTFYYRSLLEYHKTLPNVDRRYQLASELYQLIKANPAQFEDNDYVKGGCLIDCIPGIDNPVDHYEEYYAVLEDLEAVAEKAKYYDRHYYYQLRGGINFYRQIANTALGHFAEAIDFYNKLIELKSEYENLTPVAKVLILFESAYAFYFGGRPDMATQLINDIQKMKVKAVSSGRAFMRMRILQAMIAFDDKNSVTMDSQMTAAKRHAKENNFGMKELNLIHKTMTRILHSRLSQSEADEIIEKIKLLVSAKVGLSFLESFRFEQWVTSRIADSMVRLPQIK